jgi:hypothetical protein
MRLHNYIADFRERTSIDECGYERDIFDDDCRRFLAGNSDFTQGGGGAEEIHRDANFEPSRGGGPT